MEKKVYNNSCQYFKDIDQQCGATVGLSIIDFKNPENRSQTIEIALCQYHSDQILREMLETYNDCLMIEEKAFAKYNKGRQLAKKYETIQPPQDFQKLSNARKLKFKIVHKICRNMICGNQLDERAVFTATAYHAKGKMRHSFYFCNYTCWMWFKRKCGFREKMEIHQNKLTV